ncbi:MAG TPA: hypothetical protein PKH80_06860 [Methanofastidiosum sp.]|nr:hypothetical protein [Methanofastidiosum sp.]
MDKGIDYMNDDIRIGLEVIGERIEAQNKILNDKLDSLNNSCALSDIANFLKGIKEELNDIRLLLEKNSNK